MPKIKRKSTRTAASRSAAMKRSWALRKQIASSLNNGAQLFDTARAAIEHSKQFRLEAPVNAAPNAVPTATDQPIRGQLLDRAKALTLGEREQAYGDPLTNFKLAADLKSLFWMHRSTNDVNASFGNMLPNNLYSPGTAWGHAIDMIFTNLARIATAPTPETALAEDRYLDGANYFALAYEVGKRS